MIMKKTLSLLLAVIMIAMTFTAFPLTANAATVDTAATAVDKTFTIKTAEDLSAAISEINTVTTETSYVIDLRTDLNDCGIDIKNENKVKVTVTIIGNGHTLSTNTHTLVCADNGATVNIGDGESALTIQGDDLLHPEIGNDDLGLVYVLSDSTCNMRDKVTLKDRRGDNCLGGGVSVQGGTFHMFGGTIDHCGVDGGSVCYGGGVAVYAGGTFIMDGGTISNCYATTDFIETDPAYENCYAGMGGGVFVSDGSVFTMNGGTITKNTATNFGGGVAMTLSDLEVKIDPATGQEMIDPESGKGIIDLGNPKSRAAINGGTISNNTSKNGAGVFASGLIFAFANTLATDPLDTGEEFDPGLFINGGESKAVEISSNKATDMGGGVLVIGLRATRKAQIYNAQINNNTATIGAGVMNYSYWTQLDIDGCTITGNEAASSGGGVMATDNSSGGYTSIKNTTITNNTSGDIGAGVYYDITSEIRISGKDVIQDNIFDGKNNNLNIFSLEKPVTVVGDLTGSQIGLSDPTLWGDGKEDYDADAVSTLRLTDGYKDNNASLIPADAFTSDHESWVVDYGDKDSTPKTTYNYVTTKYNNNLGIPEGYFIDTAFDGKSVILVDISDVATSEELSKIKKSPITSPLVVELLGKRFVADGYYESDVSDPYDRYYYDSKSGINLNIWLYDYYRGAVNSPEESYTTTILTSKNNSYIFFLQAAGSVQDQYGQDGKIALLIQSSVNGYKNIDSSLFDNVSPEEETLIKDTPIDFGDDTEKIIYKYGLSGTATTKYIVNKNDNPNPETESEIINYDYTNEVRLVHRTKVDYHINNADIIDSSYDDGNPETDDDIFTSHVEQAINKDVKVGETIEEFYTIPEVVPTSDNSCPYIFKGWYYDRDNDNDSRPVNFGTDKYAKDIYAHWIKVEDVAKDEKDTYAPPANYHGIYGGFDLPGVQIRKEMRDYNYDDVPKTPGGLRFITSLSMDVVNQINAIKPNNIEYGYVAATHKEWIDYHKGHEKLQYVSETANGIDTSSANATNENYFGFAKNIDCTSRRANKNGVVALDHQNFGEYLLFSFVVTYEDAGSDKGKDVLARPYIHYTDANGLERVAYSEYRGASNTIGGCYTSYNTVAAMAGN